MAYCKKPKLNSFDYAVLDALGTGKANSKTRACLVRELHRKDSDIRVSISNLRYNEYPIISQANGHGYYIADNEEDIEKMIKLYETRVKKENNIKNALIRSLRAMGYSVNKLAID